MTSPPAKHDPPDDGPGREDADKHQPFREVEAGPQRHSDDPWRVTALEIARAYVFREGFGWSNGGTVTLYPDLLADLIAGALRSVDRAAREECARIADDVACSAATAYAGAAADLIHLRIRQTIKP